LPISFASPDGNTARKAGRRWRYLPILQTETPRKSSPPSCTQRCIGRARWWAKRSPEAAARPSTPYRMSARAPPGRPTATGRPASARKSERSLKPPYRIDFLERMSETDRS